LQSDPEKRALFAPLFPWSIFGPHEKESLGCFFGWVVYDDIFPGDPPRLTEFCTEMIQITIPFDADIADAKTRLTWNIMSCSEHNCYDEECKDYAERIKEARQK
jgi:hypothetical protein